MAPKAKITRQGIIDAAVEVIRSQGHENLNVRTIAKRLSCSTQPVLYHFQSMEEIRAAAYEAADAMHTAYILSVPLRKDPMMELGMNYIRFGFEEKNLFRFLFQSGRFQGMNLEEMMKNPELNDILAVIRKGMNCTAARAKRAFVTFFLLAHGIASLLANSGMEYEEEKFRKILKEEYQRMAGERK